VEELAALREAWLAVYDASEPIDRGTGLKWHEDAEKCRERIRKTISVGSGCSAVSHLPDDPVTKDPHWSEEFAVLERQRPGECASPVASDRPCTKRAGSWCGSEICTRNGEWPGQSAGGVQ